jgi:hypothetical protein
MTIAEGAQLARSLRPGAFRRHRVSQNPLGAR